MITGRNKLKYFNPRMSSNFKSQLTLLGVRDLTKWLVLIVPNKRDREMVTLKDTPDEVVTRFINGVVVTYTVKEDYLLAERLDVPDNVLSSNTSLTKVKAGNTINQQQIDMIVRQAHLTTHLLKRLYERFGVSKWTSLVSRKERPTVLMTDKDICKIAFKKFTIVINVYSLKIVTIYPTR